MKLLFVTACFYEDLKPIKLLYDSAFALGISLNYYGLGKGYTIMNAKINRLIGVLQSVVGDYTHALYTDGDDSFLTWDEESIISAYSFQGSPPCLISAEKECYPVRGIGDQFPEREHYRYPCAGGFMGEIPYLIKTLQGLKKYENEPVECNDQAYWQLGIARDNIAMIDSECEVFQTMSGGAILHLIWDKENGAYYNEVTESFPCVMHFNGRVKGIESWYGNWKRNRKNNRSGRRPVRSHFTL